MKNLYILLILSIFSNTILAQNYNREAELAAKDRKIPLNKINDFIKDYVNQAKKINSTQNVLALTVLPPFTTDLCDDGGFETKDLANWGWSTFENRKNSTSIVYYNTKSPTGNLYNSNNNYYGSITKSQWQIISTGFDPIFPALPTVHSGSKALKLGREELPGVMPNCSAESIVKTVTINANNANLSFWYAVVLQDPTTSTITTHSAGEAPSFGVRVYTSSGSVTYIPLLPSISGFSTTPINSVNNPFWTSAFVSDYSTVEQIRMRPWTCASLDLSSFIGRTISIEFLVNDCAHGGHFGYAYIDDICLGCTGSDMGDASIRGISQDCGPTAMVNGSYTLPHSSTLTGTLNSIKAELYQNGLPTGIMATIPAANINTSTKTFNFPMALFGTVPAGNYDIILKGSFTFSGSTYTTISNLTGFVAGQNNDWKPICPVIDTNCCRNSFSAVSPTAVPQSYPYSGGTYSIENFNVNVPNNVPITEIKVNVESFEIISEYKDCLKCDNKPVTLGSIFGIRTIGSGANTLTLTNQLYGNGNNVNTNNNELIWANTNGVTLNTSDKISVIYLLPSKIDIPCCATKAKICIRISWRDTNCGYCEVLTCSTVDLKNVKDLKAGFKLPDLTTIYLNSRGIFATGHANGF